MCNDSGNIMCGMPGEILYLCDAGVCMCVFTHDERLYEIQDKNETCFKGENESRQSMQKKLGV